MDRFYLLAPALILAAAFFGAFFIYSGLYLLGRHPSMEGVKHNQLLGPFFAGFIAWMIGPVERALIGRVAPNVITGVSLFACLLTGVAAGFAQLATAVWLYALAGILDILDGRLARLAGKQTAVGALFDSVSDRWGELFVFIGYAWYLHESPWLLAVFGACGASMMVSYTRARAEGLGIELSGGVMQRAERILLVAGGSLVAVLYGAAAAPEIVGTSMLICTAMSTATAINRWLVAYRELARRAAEPVIIEEAAPLSLQPVTQPLPSLSASDLRKVRPLEQH